MYIHMGLDKSLFSFENYKQVLQEVESFLNEHLKNKFICLFPPKLFILQSGNTTILLEEKIIKDGRIK